MISTRSLFAQTSLILALSLLSFFNLAAEEAPQEIPIPSEIEPIPESEKLLVVWTSGDRDVALKMVFMYTLNSKRFAWWKDVTLLVWGPSAKLLSEDKELQDYLKKIQDTGTQVVACKACADLYEVSEDLEKLGIDVKYAGNLLTDSIKSERHVITF